MVLQRVMKKKLPTSRQGDCVEREEGDFGLEELPQVRAGRLRCEGGMGGGGGGAAAGAGGRSVF